MPWSLLCVDWRSSVHRSCEALWWVSKGTSLLANLANSECSSRHGHHPPNFLFIVCRTLEPTCFFHHAIPTDLSGWRYLLRSQAPLVHYLLRVRSMMRNCRLFCRSNEGSAPAQINIVLRSSWFDKSLTTCHVDHPCTSFHFNMWVLDALMPLADLLE